MAIHQRRLLVEIAEVRQNPVLAYLDEKLGKFAAGRLERRYGERLIRMVLRALADIENFVFKWLGKAEDSKTKPAANRSRELQRIDGMIQQYEGLLNFLKQHGALLS